MEFVGGMDIQQDAKLSGWRIMRAAVNPQTATFSIPAIGRGFRVVLELP